jgi:hypothetical protein
LSQGCRELCWLIRPWRRASAQPPRGPHAIARLGQDGVRVTPVAGTALHLAAGGVGKSFADRGCLIRGTCRLKKSETHGLSRTLTDTPCSFQEREEGNAMSTTYDGTARGNATAKVAGARGVAELASLQRAPSGKTRQKEQREPSALGSPTRTTISPGPTAQSKW